MRNLRAWWGALLVAAAVTASRAEEPERPAAPTAEDAVAFARRLWEKCPGPAAAGVREVRCSVVVEPGPAVPTRVALRWLGDCEPHVTVTSHDLTEPARFERAVLSRAFSTLTFRAFWDPAVVASAKPVVRRGGEGAQLLLEVPKVGRAAVFVDGRDRPTRVLLTTGKLKCRWDDVVCSDLGDGWVPTSFRTEAVGHEMRFEVAYHDSVRGFAMPRTIDVTRANGDRERFLFHDVFRDGVRVQGTSLAEVRAGRAARRDEASRTAFARHAAAIAEPAVTTIASRVDTRVDGRTFRLQAHWWDDRTCTTAPAPGAEEGPEQRDFRIGFSRGAAAGISLDVPSFDEFDAAGTEDGSIVLTPLDPDHDPARITLRFDARGRLAVSEQDLADGGRGSTRFTYDEADGRAWVSEMTIEREDASLVVTSERWHVPGFQPLPRRTVARRADGSTIVTTHTHWVVDGRPVPGTDVDPDAPPPAPREAPK